MGAYHEGEEAAFVPGDGDGGGDREVVVAEERLVVARVEPRHIARIGLEL